MVKNLTKIALFSAMCAAFVACGNQQKVAEEVAQTKTLKGEFSVSYTEKVRFSQGNLQYQASTNTWRFAPAQFTVIGEGNTAISAQNEGWIDLFCWASSGYNGIMPYSSSIDEVDYADVEGDIAYTNYDWGLNDSIANGGQENWRTLTSAEWAFLLGVRDSAEVKLGVAQVNGVNGIVLLPDVWELPEGLSFKPGFAERNGSEQYALMNTYPLEKWQQMEDAGAVFLPAAGYRYDVAVADLGNNGQYWSSSAKVEDNAKAYGIYFFSSFVDTEDCYYRYFGRSVRLVTSAN